MDKEYKLIDYRLFDPTKSLFKTKANERAEFRKLLCCEHGRCQAFAVNTCTMWRFLGPPCPYGKIQFESGPTKKSPKLWEWVSDRKKSVEGIVQLASAATKMCLIGGYIFFPYPHWSLDLGVSIDKSERANLISGGIEYIPIDRFTADFFEEVVRARPRALFGGEIASYQKEVVPSMVLHLEECLPELFGGWKSKYPDTTSRFSVKNYIGRSAIIVTLPPGTVIPHKEGVMVWDGESLLVENYASVFMPVKVETAKLIMKPTTGATVKITSNDQVGSDTKFSD